MLASFAGQLPGELAALPERLTAAMADVLRDGRSKVTRAPLGDLLAVAGCADASDDCLQQARALLEAGRVVAGDVEPAGAGRVRVRLRLIAARQRTRGRTILLAGSSAAALEADFRVQAAAFWRDPDAKPASTASTGATTPKRATAPARPAATSPAPPTRATTARRATAPTRPIATGQPPLRASASGTTADDPPARADLAVAPPDDGEAGFSARRVRPIAWGVAGGGAGLAAIGGLLLLAAADKQNQIDDAPTDSPADLEALVDLEESGSTYASVGTVLIVVGAVSAAAGVALVVKQGREVEQRTRPHPVSVARARRRRRRPHLAGRTMSRSLPAIAVAALLAWATACSIDTRSELFRCDGVGGCPSGRVCQSGWCVASATGDDAGGGSVTDSGVDIADAGAAPQDSAPPVPDAGDPDAPGCPAVCSECVDDRCIIDCTDDGSCEDRVVCPPGLACTVLCDGIQSCEGGIDCTAATSCDLSCTSREACAGSIECGAGLCTVECSARDTCGGGLDCTLSCSCDTRCSGTNACDPEPECPAPLLECTDGFDCNSTLLGCRTCE